MFALVSFLTNIGITYDHYLRGSLNSLGPSDAYMHQQVMAVLIQILMCRLFGAKLLLDSLLAWRFSLKKINWEMSSVKGQLSCCGLNELKFPYTSGVPHIITTVAGDVAALSSSIKFCCVIGRHSTSCTQLFFFIFQIS